MLNDETRSGKGTARLWLGLVLIGLAILAAGSLQLLSQSRNAERKAAERKKGSLSRVTPVDDGRTVSDPVTEETESGRSPAPPGASSAKADVHNPMAERPRQRRGPVSYVDMSGVPQHPIVSIDIYDWAKTKTAEELIRLINENYAPLAEQPVDEEGNDVETPWENETSLKASWALALRLREDPTLYDLFRATLLCGTLTADAASRLVEILGLMRDDRATTVLLEIVKLPAPPAPVWQILVALAGRSAIHDRPSIDEYISELDYRPPVERGHFPWTGADEHALPESEIIEAYLFLFDNRMSTWTRWDRGILFGGFQDILRAYRDTSKRGGEQETPSAGYCEQVLNRVRWLATNSDDIDQRTEALRLLAVFPQGEQTYTPLLDALRGEDFRVRYTAVSELWQFRDRAQVEVALLDVAKNDPNLTVRRRAIECLPQTAAGGKEKLTLSLAWYSPEADFMTRREAICLLGSCGGEALPHLERIAVEDSDSELQAFACRQIDEIKSRIERERRRAEVEEKLQREKSEK